MSPANSYGNIAEMTLGFNPLPMSSSSQNVTIASQIAAIQTQLAAITTKDELLVFLNQLPTVLSSVMANATSKGV